MAFYESKDLVVANINNFLQSIYHAKGLDTRPLVQQHREMTGCLGDIYSRALVMSGLPKEESPTFANIPYGFGNYEVSQHLEEVFAALGLPTTQAALHQLAFKLQRRSVDNVLTEQQQENLQKLDFFVKYCEKSSNWMIRARNIIVTIGSNTKLLATVTEEEKEFAKKLDFDWYYSYSDDNNVWRRGNEKHKEVCEYVRNTLAEKPHLRKVVQTITSVHSGLGPAFFTGIY